MHRAPILWSLAVIAVVSLFVGGVWWSARRHRRLEACLANLFQVAQPQYKKAIGRLYSTNFPTAEEPISEKYNWVNGGDCGDSSLCPGATTSNIRTSSGIAFGTQPGDVPPPYTDSGALVAGNWGSDQYVQIVVYWDGNSGTALDYDEVEIRLRGTFAKNWSRTYNINCKVGPPSPNSYIQMGRANGPVEDFTPPLAELNGPEAACQNGDVITGMVIGDVISAYINGKKVLQTEDSVITSGAPGFGFFHQGKHAGNSSFGITRFTASDLFPEFHVARSQALSGTVPSL